MTRPVPPSLPGDRTGSPTPRRDGGRAALLSLVAGFEALRENPLRTALSTLGVVIGVASLVAVLALGDGMEQTARGEIERTTGVQVVVVSSRTALEANGERVPVRDYPVFAPRDLEAMRAEIAGVRATSLVVDGRATVELPSAGRRRRAGVQATMAGADDFLQLAFAEGRFFTAVEAARNAPVVVLSHRLAHELARDGDATRLVGERVRVGGVPREVIGVLAAYPGEAGHLAFVPIAAAAATFRDAPGPPLPKAMLKARSVEEVGALRARAESWLAGRYPRWERRVEVTTSTQRLEQVLRGMLLFKLFMGAITGISLVVGGIGIMNVLLASVTERTREIGVRKAIGARQRDILVQFLAESIAISGVGSAMGIALGLAGAFGVTALIRAQAEGAYLSAAVSWSTVASAALSAVLVGLVFGTYPARRAARLSPIDAIRHE